jgi:tetratricopeptide (TPR) repeat protein
MARAHFLLAEIAYEEFKAVGVQADLAATLDSNGKALAAVDRAYKVVIESGEAPWALFGVVRLAEAYDRFAVLVGGIEPPASLSPQDQKTLKAALGARAAEAQKQGAALKAVCQKQVKKGEIFSEAAKSCLLDQPLPETIPMYPQVKRGAEPAGVAPIRQALLKNPKDPAALAKLAELYLGAGDIASTLLLVERAEPLAGRKALFKSLYGLTMQQLGEPQAAGDAFKDAVLAEPNDPQWRLNLATQYAAYGYTDRARAEAKKAGSVPASPRGPLDHPEVNLLNQLDAKKAAP